MILIDKNTPHRFWADSELFINDWIAFTADEENEVTNFETVKLNTFFTTRDVPVCSNLIRLICAEETTVSIFKKDNIQYALKIILNKLRYNLDYHKVGKRYCEEFQNLRNSIYENPAQKFTIEQLARKINLSKTYFQRLYKSYFNITPISDVINSRIKYSKQLLMSTSFSVSEISEMVGYQNDTQFIKQFKKVTKMTPLEYRKEIISD